MVAVREIRGLEMSKGDDAGRFPFGKSKVNLFKLALFSEK